MDTDIIYLRKQIREQLNELANLLADNQVDTIENYRHVTGTIKGLAWVEDRIKDMLEKQQSDE